jgi:hypothetical protein
MKTYYKILLFLPTIGLLLTSFASGDKSPKPLKIGKSAPKSALAMTGVDGLSRSLNDCKGENGLLVVFSCNTCPFVVGSDQFAGWEVQYNDMNKVATANTIGMVLINSNEAKREGDDSMDAMKIRAREKAYNMHYLLDKDSELANAFGAKTTPHVYLFDKNMKLVYTGSIDNSWDSKRTEDTAYLKSALEQLGKGEKITENNTVPRGCSIKRK